MGRPLNRTGKFYISNVFYSNITFILTTKMVPVTHGEKKPRPVYKLRNKKAFESFVHEKQLAVIVVYHYLCPQCESYLRQFRALAKEYQDEDGLDFAKIHIQLKWMIRKAKLKGDVEEENTFLQDLDVGKKVPATLFYRNAKMIWKLEGVIEPPIFRGLIKKLREG